MSKFAHLQKQNLTSDPVPYTLVELEGTPTLMVKPATEANRPYYTGLLKSIGRRPKLSVSAMQRTRNTDRTLYPKYVVVGWRDVTDSKGSEVPFSVEECQDFLQHLPDYIFDDLRSFCSDPQSFVEEDEGTSLEDLDDSLGN